MEFPQYRRYKNGLSYFKILSDSHFIEYKSLGNRIDQFDIVANILPDRNFIDDMLFHYESNWEKVEESELLDFLANFDA